ncbi:hypothetical protein PRIPAC_79213 [Pristionchus pacificus]|uniref:Protein kinase domain-containing protein n=1 Tax=Pristionchus pacificus TaxID=54126 RepID=A0A2A6CK36_PRIPA|nr:hypothetical protein PRIPAC_79213 [Pristionchus pacificus]|eukprot:PDM78562.1 protein kinase [Pristionchus pacificus]
MSDCFVRVIFVVNVPVVLSAKYFEFKKFLGGGGYGIVLEAIKRIDKRKYAAKGIFDEPKWKTERRALMEVTALADCDHPGIVRYYHAWDEEPPDFWQLSENSAPETRSLSRMKSWFKQIVSAVAYIHEKKQFHRDMKISFISRYGSKTDVFTLGLILVELCLVLTSEEKLEIFDNYCVGTQSELITDGETANFVEMLTQIDPNKRPTCNEMLGHEYFA